MMVANRATSKGLIRLRAEGKRLIRAPRGVAGGGLVYYLVRTVLTEQTECR